MIGTRIVSAGDRDWKAFLALAAVEGWRVPQLEISFHRRPGEVSAYTLRRGEETLGFVTAVLHQRSGWIGNLLIRTSERGQGLGAKLFDFAVDRLRKRGAHSLWLTASAQGELLYRRRGFHPHARVARWVRAQGGEGKPLPAATAAQYGRRLDKEVWQESRENLLEHLSSHGSWLAGGESVALLQRERNQQIIGPWLTSGEENAACSLLEKLVAVAAPGQELVMDLIDRPGHGKFLSQQFTLAGETLLMAAGPIQGVRLDRLCALASLGSFG